MLVHNIILIITLVVNFHKELTPILLNNDLKSKIKILIFVGFLTLTLPPSDSDSKCWLSWLDGQKAKSILYVSFGTVAITPTFN